MGKAIERIFLPLMRLQLPEIVRHAHARRGRLPQPDAGVASASRYPGHARKVMHAIWGLGQAMFTKVHRGGGSKT